MWRSWRCNSSSVPAKNNVFFCATLRVCMCFRTLRKNDFGVFCLSQAIFKSQVWVLVNSLPADLPTILTRRVVGYFYRSYPHSCTQIKDFPVEKPLETRKSAVDELWTIHRLLWITFSHCRACGQPHDLSTLHSKVIHRQWGELSPCKMWGLSTYPHYPQALLWRI